jgi:hypothetical protein
MKTSVSYQEEYLTKQNRIYHQKKSYYDPDEKLILPLHSRYYYDWQSSQYNSYPMEKKLRDLGFLVSQGFNLKSNIRNYKTERDETVISAIPQTFVFYILFMRYGEYSHFTEFILAKLSERQLINLFMDEVSLRYNSSSHEVLTGGWDDDELIEAACEDKQTFFNLVKGVQMTKRYFSVDKRSPDKVV